MRAAALAVCLAVVLGPALPAAPEASARLFFSRSFPASAPAYFDITIARDGAAEYREDPEDEAPIRFRLAATDVETMFALADKLNRFQRPLESGKPVAKTGVKTFRYLEGGTSHQVEFNYTEDPDGQALLTWFERIGESERIYIALERAVKHDRLGVNQALLWLQNSYEKQRLVAHPQFIPLLERIVKNSSFINMARSRAANLVDAFRALNPETP